MESLQRIAHSGKVIHVSMQVLINKNESPKQSGPPPLTRKRSSHSSLKKSPSKSLTFANEAIQELNRLVAKIEQAGWTPLIVVSSSQGLPKTREEFAEMFKPFFAGKIMGRTSKRDDSEHKESDSFEIDLEPREREILKWNKSHGVKDNFIVFDQGHLNSPPMKRRVISTERSFLHRKHVDKAFVALGLEERFPPHCEKCTVIAASNTLDEKLVIFISANTVFKRGVLDEQVAARSYKALPLELKAGKLQYIVDLLSSYCQTFGIVLIGDCIFGTTSKHINDLLCGTFLTDYFLGKINGGNKIEKSCQQWVDEHKVQKTAYLNLSKLKKKHTAEQISKFVENSIKLRKWKLPDFENRHCEYCLDEKNHIEEENNPFAGQRNKQVYAKCVHIFLGIVNVLMRPKVGFPDDHSFPLIPNAYSHRLDGKAVKQLMRLIHKIEENQMSVRIVITSSLRLLHTTDELFRSAFPLKPFAPYIVGRTASSSLEDPQRSRRNLKDVGAEIDDWKYRHFVDYGKYIVINGELDKKDQIGKLIKTDGLLSKHNVDKALSYLKI